MNPMNSLFSTYRESELLDEETTSEEEPGLSVTFTPEPEPEPNTEIDMAPEPKEFGLKKPSDFDGDQGLLYC